MFLTGYSVFSGMAIGAITGVGIAVPGSLTVLPALLSMLGDRVDKGRIPLIGRRAGRHTRGHVRCPYVTGPGGGHPLHELGRKPGVRPMSGVPDAGDPHGPGR